MKMNTRFCLAGLSLCVLTACGKSTAPTAPLKTPPPSVAENAPAPHAKANENVLPPIQQKKSAPLTDAPTNIEGYGKTHWGMTEEQVLQAEAPRVERLDEPAVFLGGRSATLGIKKIEIDHSQYEVLFIFNDADHKLVRVHLKCVDHKNVMLNNQRFSSLEKLLIEKYGPPTFTTSRNNLSKESDRSESSWKLATTIIDLRHSQVAGYSDLIILYQPVEASKKAATDL